MPCDDMLSAREVVVGEGNLVRRWLQGWVASRGWVGREVEDGIWSVLVEQPGRAVEYVVLDADNDPSQIIRAAALAAQGHDWVTVATGNREKSSRALESAGLQVKGTPEWLMTIELAQQAERLIRDPYPITLERDSDVIAARVRIDGADAAHGFMSHLGSDAIADRIETAEAHRRRGLGGAVMTALVGEAIRSGAVHGLLVASSEGRELYRSLGWTVAADIVIAQAVAS